MNSTEEPVPVPVVGEVSKIEFCWDFLSIILKTFAFLAFSIFILCLPLGDPNKRCNNISLGRCHDSQDVATVMLCNVHKFMSVAAVNTGTTMSKFIEMLFCLGKKTLYEAKMKFYNLLHKVDSQDLCNSVCCSEINVISAEDAKEVDKVIEDEITQKLSEDLLQSIERKFQVDLEKSVDSVLSKIRLLLQNGTTHIQDKLVELQALLDSMKKDSAKVDDCLLEKQADTSALAEKALHQMVVCGYALIGHDPAQAVKDVLALKNMIKKNLKPLYDKKQEVYDVLKVCGHDHDTLKKVIKCVISKSPLLKTSMMEITSKLIDGVVHLTKLMAHGAMHEACLIEVIKTVEDDAFNLVKKVKICAYGNSSTDDEVNNYIRENNATVLDVTKKDRDIMADEVHSDAGEDKVSEMKRLLRRMLSEGQSEQLDMKYKDKFLKLQKDLGSVDTNMIANEVLNKEK